MIGVLALVAAACSGASSPSATVPATGATTSTTAATSPSEPAAMTYAFTVTIENASGMYSVADSGTFAIPEGADGPGALLPGSAHTFDVLAAPGSELSFATMFVQSNDWFLAPADGGVPLYGADGSPISGEIADQLTIWDSGTEIDQTIGEGADQAPRQADPDTGDTDPDSTVRLVENVPADELVSVTVTPADDGLLAVRIENTSEDAMYTTPLAPGVYAVHAEGVDPLFTPGAPERGEGLEALAEDGDPTGLAECCRQRPA